MNRRRIALIAISLLASIAFYSLYQGSLTYWDGVAIEVTPTIVIESDFAIILSESDLLAHPSIFASLAGATVDEPYVTDEMEEFEAFLYVNSGKWFTSRDIAGYLSLPLSTVQLALRQVHRMAPRVQREDIEVVYRGRREKRYRFQRLINSI